MIILVDFAPRNNQLSHVAKPALGKGLGDLLNGTSVTEVPEGEVLPENKTSVSPGIGVLLRAGKENPGNTAPKPVPVVSVSSGARRKLVPTDMEYSLFGADLMLMGICTRWVFTQHKLTLVDWVLLAAALLLGTWLSILAILRMADAKE